MDFDILYAIQNIRTPLLDKIMVIITSIPGNMGEMWIALGIILLIFKKTRKCGLVVLLSYGMVYGIVQYFLKDLIARPRPCQIDETIELLVSRPSSYSFPSTHSGWALGTATSILLYNKKCGICMLIYSILLAFSRMYLFVHFPSDVIVGIILGVVFSFLSKYLIETFFIKILKK